MRSVDNARAFASAMLSVAVVPVITGIVSPHVSIKVLEAQGLVWVSLLTLAYMSSRAVASIIHAGLYRVLSAKYLGLLGLLLITSSYALYASMPESTYPVIKLLEGFAAGIFWPLMQTLVVDSVKPEWRSRWMSIYFIIGSLSLYVGFQVGSLIISVAGRGTVVWAGTVLCIAYAVIYLLVAPYRSFRTEPARRVPVIAALSELRKVTPYLPVILLVGSVNGLMKDYLFAYTKRVTGMNEVQLRNYWSLAGYAGLVLSYLLAHMQEVMGKTREVLIISSALVASASLMIVVSDPAAVFAILTATTVGLRVIRPVLRGVVSNAVSKPEHGIAIVNAFSNIAAGASPLLIALIGAALS